MSLMDPLSRRLFDANDPDSTGIVRTLPEVLRAMRLSDNRMQVGDRPESPGPYRGFERPRFTRSTPRTRCCSRLGTAKVKEFQPGTGRGKRQPGCRGAGALA